MSYQDDLPNLNQLRALKQYRDMTDDEFDEAMVQKMGNTLASKVFEKRIQDKIDSFSDDYDITDLKANDLLNLRALAQAYIQLEDWENVLYNSRSAGGVADVEILKYEKMNMIMSALRRDISKLQDDLGITRKSRKGDKEATVVNYLEEVKNKAKEFYEAKHFYIWCPECKMLLATVWFLYPEEAKNKIQLVCNRPLDDDGNICGHKLQISSKELMERHGVNIEEVPEFFK